MRNRGDSMKKVCVLLVLVLLLGLSSSAWAEEDFWVEVIKMDGMSVVVLGDNTLMMGEQADFYADEAGAAGSLSLPKALTTIGERAFEGIAAARVDVSENVVSIGPYAFADCENLREILIPASVTEIDDTAFDKCHDVIVYGTRGTELTEAERIAKLYGFRFVDLNEQTEPSGTFRFPPAPVLPAVSLR